MDDTIREALRDLLGANVVEVHDLRPQTKVRKVWRVRTAGHHECAIVKAIDRGAAGDADTADRAWTMVDRDATSLAAAAASGCVPRVLAHDTERRIVVIEDLGAERSLADVLLDDDANAARAGLVGLATSLGRIHASTPAAGFAEEGVHMTSGALDVAHEIVAVAAELGVAGTGDGFVDDVDTAAVELQDPGPLNVLVHGDPCPDNNVIRADGSVALFDFEWGSRGSALLDAAYLHLPFPSCWCANSIPDDVVRDAEEAYRSAFVVSDSSFASGLAAAAVAWCVSTVGWSLRRVRESDGMWGIAPERPRIFTRLRATRQLCDRADRYHAFSAFAGRMEESLAGRWPDAIAGLPLYPAFQ